jgi:supervillin
VNPTKLELYLSDEDFEKCLGVSKAEFNKLPLWKKNKLKKDNGLF